MTAQAGAVRRGTAILVVVAILLIIVISIPVAAGISTDDVQGDVCQVAAQTQADVTEALEIAADPSATVEDVRAGIDTVLVDLTALRHIADDRYSTAITDVHDQMLDLSRSLAAVDQSQLASVVRPLVDDTVDDARAAFGRLADLIAPVCADRSA